MRLIVAYTFDFGLPRGGYLLTDLLTVGIDVGHKLPISS